MAPGVALRRVAALGATAALAVSLVACGGGSKAGGAHPTHVTSLRLEVSVGTTDTVVAWAAEVERLSGGRLRIEVITSPLARGRSPGEERQVIGRVRSGAVPLAAVGARAFDEVGVRSFQPLVAPFLIDSYDLERRVLASSLPDSMLAGTRPLGLIGVAVLPGPLRRMLGTASALREPSDFQGATVGIQRGQVAAATFRALGARAQPIAPEAPISGIDGLEQQIGSVSGNAYYSAARYYTTNLAFWPRELVVLVNAGVYHRLAPSDRKALEQAAHAALPAEMATVRLDDREGLRVLCSPDIDRPIQLVTSSPAQLLAMSHAVAPVYSQIEDDTSRRAAVQQIEALKRTAKPDTAPVCTGSAPGATTSARTPLDGVYEMDTSPADVSAAVRARDPDTLAPENLGHWIFVFDRGRFADTQEYRNACTWGYGTFTVTGRTMRWIFTKGGGIAPTDAMNKPGEDFQFTWSDFRDKINVGPVKGAISPDNFRLRPWHRISRQPSSNYFAKRCPPPANWDGPPVTSTAPKPSPVVGVWRLTDTAAEVHDEAPENWGTSTWVFENGRFASTTQNAKACVWAYGTFDVTGHVLSLTFAGGGGHAPTDAANKPGEHFSFHWNVFHDSLTLTAGPPGSVSPGGMLVKPFRRVSATPADRYLAGACRPPVKWHTG